MRFIKNIVLIGLIGLVSACESFEFGQQYNVEGNRERERPLIEAYLADNPYDGLYTVRDTASAVAVIVLEEGTGSRPQNGTVVYADYVAKLLDGTVFNTSIRAVAEEHGLHTEERTYNRMNFIVTETGTGGGAGVAGLSYGFRKLRSGAKAVIVVPSPLGYRDSNEIDRVPPNSILLYEVDFLGID